MFAWYLLIPILLPAFLGLCLGVPAFAGKQTFRDRSSVRYALTAAICATFCASVAALNCTGNFVLWHIGGFALMLNGDTLGKFFSVLFSFAFMLAGYFGLEYFEHDEHQRSYTCFYLLTLASLQGLCFAGNLFTFYMFYEMMTLCSLPLVLHERTAASRRAAMQYLGYSLFGASLALFGFFFAEKQCFATLFTPGGNPNLSVISAQPGLMLMAAFCLLLGFGGKAGLLPLHAWLPIAHPEAPAPASAVLSGIITKGGVLGIIRVAYYVYGPDVLRGTWVQYVLLGLSLATVFMGSMLAYKEQILKKRLAYSTVSQVSYALFGLFLLCPTGFCGALLQIVFHALAKIALFLSAGAVIHATGYTRADQLKGLGYQMPDTLWCFTLAGLSLVGIPPLGGFVSKWYLAQGSLEQLGGWGWLGAAVLLISALLTAGYLLTISSAAFFPGKDWPTGLTKHPLRLSSIAPLMICCALLILFGLWPTGLLKVIAGIAATVL